MRNFSLTILVVLFIGISIFLYFNFKENPKESERIVLDTTSELVASLYSMVNPSDDALTLIPVYSSGEIIDDYKIAIGIMSYLKENPEIDPIYPYVVQEYIDKAEVKKHIEKILGSDVNYTDKSVYIRTDGVCGYTFNKELKRYENIPGCGGSQFEFIKRKITEAYQQDNKIYILEKSIYVFDDWDDYISKKYIYDDCNQNKLLNYLETDSSGNYVVSLEDYLDHASTYQYVFEKINDQYIFKSLKKIS